MLLTAALALFTIAGAGVAAPPFAEEWAIPSSPEDVEVDPWGRVWVSCDDDTIRVYEPTGGVLLFAFGGTGTGDGEFFTPYGIAFDAAGSAYICDYLGARVQQFDSAGSFLNSWTVPSANADHVAVDSAGDVYVTGYTDLSVHKYTAAGVPLLDWTSQNETQTAGVVVVGGTVHVVQWNGPYVEQFATDGTPLGSFLADTFGGADIEVDAVGAIWVCDFFHDQIRVFAADGTPVDVFGGPGTGPGEFNGAIGAAIGLDGSVYIADQYNYRVQRFGDSAESVPDGTTARPAGLYLQSVVPNPCRTGAVISWTVPRSEQVRVTVADVGGREVATLADSRVGAGVHQFVWPAVRADGRRLDAGVYFVRAVGESGSSSARIVVVR